MIAYSKAFGSTETLNKIHEFMSRQESEVIRLTKKQNEPQEYGL